MTLGYQVDENKQSKKMNKFAIVNCIIGIPTIALLILLMAKGFLADHIVTSSLALSVLAIGVGYSIFRIVKEKKNNEKIS
ncbi:MAG: hypothetical protein KAS47_06095 [Candidatus Heimdallarchaeota archaeon]|nr:hypothetical protein [Candidatus Heimdallarchaeota archaeon]